MLIKKCTYLQAYRATVPSLKEDTNKVILEKISKSFGSTYMTSLRELSGEVLVSIIKRDFEFI